MNVNANTARVIVAAGLGLVLVGSVGLGRGEAAESPVLGSYRVVSHGDAVRFRFVDQGAPVFPGGEVFAASPATTGAFIDSTGQSSGYASAPYPGEAWIAMPGTYNGVRPPGSPAAPPYPWYVSTGYPGNPEAQLQQGPIALQAKSGPDTSNAVARSGAVSGGPAGVLAATAASTVAVDQAKGALSAVSDVTVEGFSLGSDVSFGHLASHAKLTGASGAPPAKETSFSVASFTVGGQTVGFTDKGFVLGSGPAQAVDAAPLDKLTSPGGVTVTYLPATETPTSIESAGFAVSFRQTVPNQGATAITMTFGRVKVELEALAAAPDLGSADVAAPVIPDGGAPSSGVGPDTAPLDGPGALAGPAGGGAASAAPPALGGFFRSGVPAAGPSDAGADGPSPATVESPAAASVGGSGRGGASNEEALALARRNAATLAALSRTSAGHHLYVALIIAGLAAAIGGMLFGRRAVHAAPGATLRFPGA